MNNFVSLSDYKKSGSWGLLSAINLGGCDKAMLTDEKVFKKFVVELCKVIKMTRHGQLLIDRFGEKKLYGYSTFQFIKTSSITCHYDDVCGKVFVDIFSCRYFNSKVAVNFCKKFFKAENVEVINILRK